MRKESSPVDAAREILLVVLLLTAQAASANPCGAPGHTQLFRQDDNLGFFFEKNIAKRTLLLRFPGTDFEIDRSAAEHINAFTLDGIYYQSLTTSTKQFETGKDVTSSETILARHAKWESDAARKSPSPLNSFEDLGNRLLPASNGTPALTFKLWRLYGSKDGISQFFLTTVVDDEVVVLSAVVPQVAKAKFLQVASAYASGFRYLREAECQASRTRA